MFVSCPFIHFISDKIKTKSVSEFKTTHFRISIKVNFFRRFVVNFFFKCNNISTPIQAISIMIWNLIGRYVRKNHQKNAASLDGRKKAVSTLYNSIAYVFECILCVVNNAFPDKYFPPFLR